MAHEVSSKELSRGFSDEGMTSPLATSNLLFSQVLGPCASPTNLCLAGEIMDGKRAAILDLRALGFMMQTSAV